jgi:hypothetical protein
LLPCSSESLFFPFLSKNVKNKILKNYSFTVVFYECETLSLKLREEHRFMMFERRALKRIFGPKRDEVTGG